MDAVTEVLLERAQYTDRLSGMVAVSLLGHAVLIAAVAISPRLFPQAEAVEETRSMVISFAGGTSQTAGLNPIAHREIQQAVPDPSKVRTDTPPPVARPEMVESIATKKPEPKTPPKPEPKKPEPQLRGRTPTQGAEVRAGGARVETGQTAAIPFGGLASSGGPMGGAYTDFADFCCPEYLIAMQRAIYANWQQKQGQVGTAKVKFVIQRDGTITDIAIEQSAGPFLDLASQRALEQTRRLPPLPAPFTNPRLTVHLEFQYKQ